MSDLIERVVDWATVRLWWLVPLGCGIVAVAARVLDPR